MSNYSFFRQLFALTLILVLMISLSPVSAFAVTQGEVDAVRARRDQLSAQREAKQAVVDELEAEQAGVLERKTAMDERNQFTIEQMQLNSEEIDLYDRMIDEKAAELEQARAREARQLERYRTRVRAMEENGNLGFLALVLKTSTLGDFLTRMDDVGEIMKSDRELQQEYLAARENTERIKGEFELVKTSLEQRQDELREEQIALQAEIDEATELIRGLQEDIDGHREEVEQILAVEEQADRELQELMEELERQRLEELKRQQEAAERAAAQIRAEQAAAQAAQAAAQAAAEQAAAQQAEQSAETGESEQSAPPAPVIPAVTGTGSFIWPVPSCTYITSRFGLRIHPIYHTERNHSGLDVGAGYGATIVAADSGSVIRAGNSGDGYGNCVIIDHGNGYMTLYGHMSSLTVREGQNVSQGDTVGYVGSTGLSTGPHCHFEVWSGGSRIDPEQFFSGLTFSPNAGE